MSPAELHRLVLDRNVFGLQPNPRHRRHDVSLKAHHFKGVGRNPRASSQPDRVALIAYTIFPQPRWLVRSLPEMDLPRGSPVPLRKPLARELIFVTIDGMKNHHQRTEPQSGQPPREHSESHGAISIFVHHVSASAD